MDLFNRELESQVLGMLMVEPELMAKCTVAVHDFGTTDHQLIYNAILTVYEEERTTLPHLVAKHLDISGDLNRIGGTNYLFELQAPITECTGIEYYISDLKSLSAKREICRIAHKAIKQAEDVAVSAEQAAANMQLALEELSFEHKSLPYYSAQELQAKQFPDLKWFIPDMLHSGLTVLAGPAKIGKSYFCWNIALAVAMGGIVFSEIDLTQRRNVTYLSFEDSDALLKRRLSAMCEVMPNNLFILHDLDRKKLDAEGLKLLKQHIDDTQSELIFVDTWAHVAPPTDNKGTSYNQDYEALIPIHKFANRHNIGIVLVTHTRKATDIDNPFNQIQGSTGVQAGCDTMMMLSHDSGAKTLYVKGKNMVETTHAFTVDEGIWCLEGDAQTFQQGELRKHIVSLLAEAGDLGLSAGDLIDLTGKKDSNVRNTLRRMIKDGEIEQPQIRANYFFKSVADDEDELSLFDL